MPEPYKGRNQDRKDFKVVGKWGIPGRLSYSMTTGAAKFARDTVFPDMLFGQVLRSPYARARIKSLDVSKAKALPGVMAVITWEDPELKAMPPIDGGGPVLSNEAGMEGEEVGVCLAAVTEEIADAALRLIQVEWEVLPHVLDARDALKPGAAILQPKLKKDTNVSVEDNWEDGNVETGFKQADRVVEFDFSFPMMSNFHPNPITVVARWEQNDAGSEGKTLYIQGVYAKAAAMAAFKLPEDKCVADYQFEGGKFCNFTARRIALLAPLLAKRTGRPVRMAYTRRDQFEMSGAQVYSHMKVGFKNDGLMTAASCQVVHALGAAGYYNTPRSMIAFRSTKCTNIKQEAKCVFNNTSRAGGDRGIPHSGHYLAMALGKIAAELGMDPTEVALKNCHTPEPSLKACIDAGKKAMAWQWHPAAAKKLANGRMHGLGFRYYVYGRFGLQAFTAALTLKPDGKVYLPNRAFPWTGNFGPDACAMVAAEELGARIEDVIVQNDSDELPFVLQSRGSNAGATATWVVKEAALDLRDQLLNAAALKLKVKPEELDTKDSTVYLKADPTKSYGFGTFGTFFASYSGSCPPFDATYKTLTTLNSLFCEVEVDTETGLIEITKLVGVSDAGKMIRPSSYLAQIEGNLIWTAGQAQSEELIYDKPSGVLLNGSALDYKIPTLLDADTIQAIGVETRIGGGCYGAAGVSHQIMDRAVVLLAVQNAIGKWIDPPITPDKVLQALGKI